MQLCNLPRLTDSLPTCAEQTRKGLTYLEIFGRQVEVVVEKRGLFNVEDEGGRGRIITGDGG